MMDDRKAFDQKRLAAIDRLRHDGSLSASIRVIGAEILRLANFETGYAWASETYLAEKLGVAHRTVKMAVKALKDGRYVEVVKHGRNNRYVPIFDDEKGQNLPLSTTEQVQNLPLSDADRGKKQPEKGQKTTSNRGKKVPPIPLEIPLGTLRASASVNDGAPDGAVAPTLFDLGPAGNLLRERLGASTYQSWLAKIAVVNEEGDELTLSAPTKFVASYVTQHYTSDILDCWRKSRPDIARLKIVVSDTAAKSAHQRAVERVAGPENSQSSTATDAQLSARWLLDVGRAMVRDRMYVSSSTAELTIIRWLTDCENDAPGLAAILSSADEQNLTGQTFRDVVGQRVKALVDRDQKPLPLPPVQLRRTSNG